MTTSNSSPLELWIVRMRIALTTGEEGMVALGAFFSQYSRKEAMSDTRF